MTARLAAIVAALERNPLMRGRAGLTVLLGLVPTLVLGASTASSEVIDNSGPGRRCRLQRRQRCGGDQPDIFSRRDDAYGAFQRGYYLTALSLALPRAEKADPAAQTLIAEIYAKAGRGAERRPRLVVVRDGG